MEKNIDVETMVNKNLLPMTKLCVKELNSFIYFGAYFNVEFIGVVDIESFEIMVGLIPKDDTDVVNCFIVSGDPSTRLMYIEILEKIKSGDFKRHRNEKRC